MYSDVFLNAMTVDSPAACEAKVGLQVLSQSCGWKIAGDFSSDGLQMVGRIQIEGCKFQNKLLDLT